MSELSAERHETFLLRVVKFAGIHFPHLRNIRPDALGLGIADEIETAEGFGLITEQEIVSYVIAAITLGSGFHRDPEIGRYLRGSRPPINKAMFLDAMLTASEIGTGASAITVAGGAP